MTDGPKFWLLEQNEYFDDVAVLGIITDLDQAAALTAALAGSDEFDVREVPVLSDVTVETLWSTITCACTVKWNGRDGEYLSDPTPELLVHGIPGYEPTLPPRPQACTVDMRATESGYTLGVSLRVWGTDHELVLSTYARRRAELVADPAGQTIAAWVASRFLPRWTFGRVENHALLPALADALRAAGKGALVDECIERGS
jgi:hypothetical protein